MTEKGEPHSFEKAFRHTASTEESGFCSFGRLRGLLPVQSALALSSHFGSAQGVAKTSGWHGLLCLLAVTSSQGHIFTLAWPSILSELSTPFLGLVDTVVPRQLEGTGLNSKEKKTAFKASESSHSH